MKLKLAYWNRKWQGVSFDCNSGKGRVDLLPLKNKSISGWGYKKNGVWYCVYASSGRLIFQCGMEKYQIPDDLLCEMEELDGNLRKLILRSEEGVVFSTEFQPQKSSWTAKFDATRDLADDVMEDFFVWLCMLWQDRGWQKDFLSLWSSGVSRVGL